MQELQSLPAFRGVSAADIAELFALSARVQLAEGEVLYRQGEEGADAVLLLQGALLLVVAGPGGAARTVGDVLPGELAGEQALFVPGTRRSTSVVARAPSVGLRLTRGAVSRSAANPALAALEAHMLRVLTRRLRGNDAAVKRAWIADLERMPPEARPPGLLERLRAWLGAA